MLITVGEIGAPHGVKGEFRVHPVTDFPDRFARTRELYVVPPGPAREGDDAAARKYLVRGARPTGGGPGKGAGGGGSGPWIMCLDGVTDRDEAAALRGALLKVPEEQLTPLPDGHYYLFQIIGLRAVTADGRPVGNVVDVLKYQANDVYVVRPAAGGEAGGSARNRGKRPADYLVPAIHEAVAEIDVQGRRLVLWRHPAEVEET